MAYPTSCFLSRKKTWLRFGSAFYPLNRKIFASNLFLGEGGGGGGGGGEMLNA